MANNQRGFISKCLGHVGGVHQNAALAHRNLAFLDQAMSKLGRTASSSEFVESFFEEAGSIQFHDTRLKFG